MAMERDQNTGSYPKASHADRLHALEQSFHAPLDGRDALDATNNYQNQKHPPSPLSSQPNQVSDNVLNLSEMLGSQWLEFQHARLHTNQIFDNLLTELSDFTDECRQGLTRFFREPETREHFSHFPRAHSDIQRQIYSHIDADRSVGILNLLWHTLSFTMRGNTRPLALKRTGNAPLFTGRIVALLGDFQELTEDNVLQDFPELLTHEVASLYIPAHHGDPYVMRLSHLGDKDHFLSPDEAPRTFILKVVETVCAGGYFHEKKPSDLF